MFRPLESRKYYQSQSGYRFGICCKQADNVEEAERCLRELTAEPGETHCWAYDVGDARRCGGSDGDIAVILLSSLEKLAFEYIVAMFSYVRLPGGAEERGDDFSLIAAGMLRNVLEHVRREESVPKFPIHLSFRYRDVFRVFKALSELGISPILERYHDHDQVILTLSVSKNRFSETKAFLRERCGGGLDFI